MKRALLIMAAMATLCRPRAGRRSPGQEQELHGLPRCRQKAGGPVLQRSVAKKYAGDAKAVDMLATKIIKGGSGVWGAIPMPANPQVNEADAKKLAAWVLSLK